MSLVVLSVSPVLQEGRGRLLASHLEKRQKTRNDGRRRHKDKTNDDDIIQPQRQSASSAERFLKSANENDVTRNIGKRTVAYQEYTVEIREMQEMKQSGSTRSLK